MSEDPDLDSVVTVSADGISVEKRFDRDQFAVPAVTFTIRSDNDEAASVRLVDDVPEEFPMDSVGFHPDYENDNWTAFKDHRVEFEREFAPGEEVVTVYGVRLSESDRAAAFMGEPKLAEVSVGTDETPPDPLASLSGGSEAPMDGNTITDIVSEEGNQIVRDVIAGERDTLPGLDDEATEPAGETTADADPLADVTEAASADDAEEPPVDADPLDEEPIGPADDDPLGDPSSDLTDDTDPLAGEQVEPTDESEPVAEPAGDVAVEATPAADSDEETGEILTAEPDLPSTGDVAATLAEEIRQGSVTDGDLAVLRQELDATLPESTNVRIRHLQSRIEDLTAYTEALEDFIDENGTASRVFEEFESFEGELEGLTEELDELQSEVEDAQSVEDDLQAIETLEESVEALRDEQAETHERVEALESDVEAVSTNLDETQDRLDDVRAGLDDLEDLEAEIASLREDLEGVADLEDSLADIEGLRTDVAGVRTEFEELEELVGANTQDITGLDDTLSNVEAELAGVTDVESDLASLDERVEELTDTVTTTEQSVQSAIENLESDVASINDDIEEIRTWRDQLKGVFGAGGD